MICRFSKAIEGDRTVSGAGGSGGTVRVRCFAALRERAGAGELTVAPIPGETVSQLYARLFPADGAPALPVAFVRNRAQVAAETTIEPGDEVAFLPPVGGG